MINYCRACKSRTLSHDLMLQCHLCTQVVHIKCIPLTRDEYKHINDRNCAWLCRECSDDTIPFYHIDDEEEFIESLYAFYSDLPIDLSVISNMIFNPLSTNENFNSPLLDNDPDVNFYNDIQRLFVDNSPYLYEDHFNTCLSKLADHPNFGLFHINIRSLAAHKNELQLLLQMLNYQFSIIGLTETWLTDTTSSLFNIDGYVGEFNNRYSGDRGGGVGIFVKAHIPYCKREQFCLSDEFIETIFLEFDKDCMGTDKGIIVGVIYRPPNTDPR